MNPKHVSQGNRLGTGAIGLRALLFAGTATMACSIHALPVLAQSVAEAVAVDEIIVTAQRRSERLEDVPAAITVISGDTLAKSGVVGFQDLGSVTAGAQVNFAGAYTQPSIRGITTLTNGNNVENNVAVYVDGFYEPSPLVINADLPNLDSIEVLKGPQGTLYGRNATGGAILINTLVPSRTLTGRAEITYARFNDKRVSAYVSGPLSDTIRFGVAAYYRDTDSYAKLVDPVVLGNILGPAAPVRQAAVRAKLEIDATENLKLTLGYNFVHVDDPRANLFTPLTNVSPAVAPPPLRATEPGLASYNYTNTAPTTNHQGTLKMALDTGVGRLTSYTGYTDSLQKLGFDNDGTYRDLSYTRIGFRQKTFQQAADFVVTAFDKLDLVVGAFYFNDRLKTAPAVSILGPGQSVLFNVFGSQNSDAWAAYADATYHVADALSVTLGGRYSHDSKSLTSVTRTLSGLAISGPAATADRWSKFTPRAVVRYEIAPRTNIYASYSRGFRAGAFSFNPPTIVSEWRAVRPETITAYEVGFKLARRGFRFDTAAFYYDYRDLHVSTLSRSPQCGPVPPVGTPDTCQSFLTVYQNAPKAEIYGMEAQLSATPTDNLNIRAGVSLLHGRYKVFPNATGTGLNGATNQNAINQFQDWSGQQMARAPSYSGNAGFDYRIPNGEGGIVFAANANFTASYVVNNASLYGPLAGALADQQRFRQSAYALANASVTWTDASGHMHVTVFGRNLTDHKYFITKTGNANGSYGSLADPLTYGVSLGFNF